MQRPLRILFLHATREYAPEYKAHRLLAEHADPARLECHFIWQDRVQDRSKRERAALPGDANRYRDFGRDLSYTPKPTRLQRAAWILARLPGSLRFLYVTAARLHPDAIYTSQQFLDVALGRLLARSFRIPHLIHLNYNVGPWLGWLTFETIQHSQYLIACSEYIRRGAIDAGVCADHLQTLHNPADLQRFDVPRRPAELRRTLGLPADARVVVAAGRLDPNKGYMTLLEAFAEVKRALPNSYLLICGATMTRDAYDRRITQRVGELGLESSALFLGQRDDLPFIFAGSDAFALATENDPCPLVFLEAMAAGLPAVGCSSGGVPELVADGVTGLLAPAGDSAALARLLGCLLGDDTRREVMGRQAKRRALIYFAPARLAAEWTGIVERYVAATR